MRLLTNGSNPMSVRMGTYTSALVEVEFISNPDVVERLIMRPDAFDVIAQGLEHGVLSYYAAHPSMP
jgi:N-acetylmuramoyl-L-alanine amidase